MNKRAVLIDLWKTLIVDTGAYKQFIQESFPRKTYEEIHHFVLENDFGSARNCISNIIRTFYINPQKNKNEGIAIPDEDTVFRMYLKFHELIPQVNPYAITALVKLKKRNIRFALVSNSNNFLEDAHIRTHIGSLFEKDLIILSHKVGYRKPHPKIYQAALERLCLTPQEVIMIGDQLEKDVLPIEKLGGTGILYDPNGKSDYKGNKINDLREILGYL